MLIYNSPQLFAVSHVLRRLPVPRHSPYALLRLNSLFLVLFHCLSFVTVNCLGCLELLSQSLALLSFYHSRGKIVVSHFLGKTFFDLLISKNLCSIICSFACFLFIQFSMIFPAALAALVGSSGTSHHAPTYRVLKRCACALGFVLFDPRRSRGLVAKSSNLAPTYRVLKRCAYAPGSPIFHLWWAQVDSNHRPRAYQARALTC